MYELWEYLTIAQAFALVGAAWVLLTLVGWLIDYRRTADVDVAALVGRLDDLHHLLDTHLDDAGTRAEGQLDELRAIRNGVEGLVDERPAGVPAPRPVMGAQR